MNETAIWWLFVLSNDLFSMLDTNMNLLATNRLAIEVVQKVLAWQVLTDYFDLQFHLRVLKKSRHNAYCAACYELSIVRNYRLQILLY